MDIIDKNNLYDSNPVGKLIEFFHEFGRNIIFPDPIRISNADEPPLYRCTIEENFKNEEFLIISKDLSSKCYAMILSLFN